MGGDDQGFGAPAEHVVLNVHLRQDHRQSHPLARADIAQYHIHLEDSPKRIQNQIPGIEDGGIATAADLQLYSLRAGFRENLLAAVHVNLWIVKGDHISLLPDPSRISTISVGFSVISGAAVRPSVTVNEPPQGMAVTYSSFVELVMPIGFLPFRTRFCGFALFYDGGIRFGTLGSCKEKDAFCWF